MERKKKEDDCRNEYGDGLAWYRGAMIGKGSYGSVYLATLKNPSSKYSYFPSIMAVKSAEVSVSGSIQKEKEILSNVSGCCDVIQCLGEEITIGENGVMAYNLLLEYGSGGTLADRIKKSATATSNDRGGLPELEAKCYTRSILRGLDHVHRIGYVHCDLKPENILLVGGGSGKFRAKIGDFGLAKRAKQSKKRKLAGYWRGTPVYLSPETAVDNVQEPPGDIWAVGCIVVEMLTGRRMWEGKEEMNAEEIVKKIGKGHEFPVIPNELSKEAKDFLKGCFVRNPKFRFTAEMLLNHTFLEGLADEDNNDDDNDYDSENASEELEEYEDMCPSESCDDDLIYEYEDSGYYRWEEGIVGESEVEVTSTEFCSSPEFDHMMKKPRRSPAEVSLRDGSRHPVSFAIPAGM